MLLAVNVWHRGLTQLPAFHACRRYPLAELISTLRELYPLPAKATSPSSHPSAADAGTNSSSAASSSSESASSSSKKRGSQSDDFVVIEYVLLKDVNDTDADAHRLLELLSEVYCMINLIVFNPHEGTAFQRSDEQQVRDGWEHVHVHIMQCYAMPCHAMQCGVAGRL